MPYDTLPNRGLRRLVAQVIALCRERQVDTVVIGLPLQADGRAGAAARLPQRVAEELAGAGFPTAFWDESYTSDTARGLLAGNVPVRRARAEGMVDRIAAALILQSYLEHARAGAEGEAAVPRTPLGAASLPDQPPP